MLSTSPRPDGTISVHWWPGTYTLLVQDYGRQQQATVKTATFMRTETDDYPRRGLTVDASDASIWPIDVKRSKST